MPSRSPRNAGMIACVLLVGMLASAAGYDRFTLRAWTDEKQPRLGLLDSAGAFHASQALPLPQTSCGWDLGEGTMGQSSTTFFMNGSWFLLAQEVCDGTVNSTALLGIMGPFPEYHSNKVNPARVYQLASFDKSYNVAMAQWNAVWDWTCNVVVIAPAQKGSVTTFHALQVSEYDGEVRPQPDFLVQKNDAADGWVKVPGMATLTYPDDFAVNWHPQDPHLDEINCGDACQLYTLEEEVKSGVAQKPRMLVGRSFRTAKELSKIPDRFQAQTMSLAGFHCGEQEQFRRTFIGLGVCCTDAAWCSTSCKGHADELILFGWDANGTEPYLLHHLGVTGAAAIADATRLGVAISSEPFFFPEGGAQLAYLYLDARVVAYNIECGSKTQRKATLNSTSTAHTPRLGAWSLNRMDFDYGDGGPSVHFPEHSLQLS